MRFLYCLLLLTTGLNVLAHPGNNKWKERTETPDYLHRTIKQVTDVIVHDIYSPPVASRTYAYITIAAYEACRYADKNYISLAGQLHDLKTFPVPDSDKEYSYSLAAVNAILLVAKTMVISEEKILEFHAKQLDEFKKSGMPADVFENSQAFGKKIADHILAWAALDNYKQTRSLPRYEVTDDIMEAYRTCLYESY